MRRWRSAVGVISVLVALAVVGCRTTARVAVIEQEVATITSIALLNPTLTTQQEARVKAAGVKIHDHLEALK